MNREETTKLLNSSLSIINKYKWLIDLYVLDFFVDDHWSKISQTWRNFISDVKAEDLAFLIDIEGSIHNYKFDKVWPLEILALKASIKAYSLQRSPWKRSEVAKAIGILGKRRLLVNECFHY